GSPLSSYAAPMLHILRSGRPDWLVYREKFPDLENVKNHLRKFPDLAKGNPALLSAQSCGDLSG
ncbi:MAG: hypothetical protein K9G62_05600, partial [Alphaproteobacteria bacterium]|nr:hypothetical protein [Alphaproteobacteria bacterium]